MSQLLRLAHARCAVSWRPRTHGLRTAAHKAALATLRMGAYRKAVDGYLPRTTPTCPWILWAWSAPYLGWGWLEHATVDEEVEEENEGEGEGEGGEGGGSGGVKRLRE